MKNLIKKDAEEYWEFGDFKKQQRALLEKFTIGKRHGEIYMVNSSSGNSYQVTLSDCNCPDYQENFPFPCKHMYYLAHELNWFNLETGLLISEENDKIIDFAENKLEDDTFEDENCEKINIYNMRKYWVKNNKRFFGSVDKSQNEITQRTYVKPSTVGIGKRCKVCKAVIDCEATICPSCNLNPNVENNGCVGCLPVVFGVIVFAVFLKLILG